jgi:hypothetical protein
MITESVEVSRPLREAYDRWTRDETIPAAMRDSERQPGEHLAVGDQPEIAWSDHNDAPGQNGRVRFMAASESTTTIVIELDPEPESEGGDAGPRARGLLERFRDSFPASAGNANTPLGSPGGEAGTEPAPDAEGGQAPPPDGDAGDVDIAKRRHVPGFPSNR